MKNKKGDDKYYTGSHLWMARSFRELPQVSYTLVRMKFKHFRYFKESTDRPFNNFLANSANNSMHRRPVSYFQFAEDHYNYDSAIPSGEGRK